MSDHGSWSHARQFLLSPHALHHPDLSVACGFAGRSVAMHGALAHAACAQGKVELVILGDILDPRDPLAGNESLCSRLAGQVSDFPAFEDAVARLAGRWVALVRVGDQVRLYPDAGGTKSAFYCAADAGVHVASQPGLLVHAGATVHMPQVERDFKARAHADSWPLGFTPFRGVRQLLPNHCLDLQTGQAVRFWPQRDLPVREPAEVAGLALELLGGTVVAAAQRGRTTLPLTAGYDSRSIFAAALKAGVTQRIRFARIAGHHLPFYDTLIPAQIAREFGLRLAVLRSDGKPQGAAERIKLNVSHMMWDPAEYMMPSFGQMESDYILLGQLSEIARCAYARHETAQRDITPEVAARYAGCPDNPLALPEVARWCKELPVLSRPSPLDLLYWENRVGTWASLMATAIDTFSTVLFPYNSRELLAALLGVDASLRMPPYPLHRGICERASPKLLVPEFNDSWLDRSVGRAPWKLQRLLALARRGLHRL